MLAVCAPAPVTRLPGSASGRCFCWFAFPLVPALRSTDSAADCSALFAVLHSYYGEVRLLASVHHRLRLLTFPMRACNGGAVPVRPEISQLPMRSLCT